MGKNNLLKYIIIFCIIIVIYLIVDFLNIFNIVTKELNFDAFSILVNTIAVVFVFLITYSLVDKKTFEREQKITTNKISLLDILLMETYKNCMDSIKILDNEDMLKKYIIPKVNFNSANDKIIENLRENPFKNETYIVELFSDGIVNQTTMMEYFEIKTIYQKYINMKITFFDIDDYKDTAEQIELSDLLNIDEETLKDKLNKKIQIFKEGE